MEKKVKKKGKNFYLIGAVSILLCVTTLISVLKLEKLNKSYNDIRGLEEDYSLSKQEAEKNLKRDEKKWDRLAEIEENSNRSVYLNEGEDELITYNSVMSESNPMILRDQLKNEASKEFIDAIDWAEEQNASNPYIRYSPFDKEGFIDTYYKKTNQIKENLQKHNLDIKVIELERERLHLGMMLLIAELGILILSESIEDISKQLSLLSLIILVMSIAVIVMGI